MRPKKLLLIFSTLGVFLLIATQTAIAQGQASFQAPPTPINTSSLSDCAIYTSSVCQPCSRLTTPSGSFSTHNLKVTTQLTWCGNGATFSFPVYLGAGQAITWNYQFSPKTRGAFTGEALLEFNYPEFPEPEYTETVQLLVTGTTAHGICLYESSDGALGHVFVQLIPNDGFDVGANDRRWGKYPASKRTRGPGRIANDGNRSWGHRICYPLTVSQYHDVSSFINREMENPSDYDIEDANCVHWAQDVAFEAGVLLPSTAGFLSYASPSGFEKSLRNIGHLGKFSDGFVEISSQKSEAEGPFDWDPGAIVEGSHSAASGRNQSEDRLWQCSTVWGV